MRVPDWLLNYPIAHRGLHEGESVPENSLAAFDAAASAGFPIELDIRIPKTGAPVAFHDGQLARITGASGNVADSDFSELIELMLYSTDQKIPSFQQVLDLVDGRVPLLVEIKTENHSSRMESETCRILRRYAGDFAVQSFDTFTVEWLKNHAPEFTRGLICESMAEISETEFAACDPDFVACEHRGLPDARQNFPLLAWTVRSEKEAAAALRIADNLIFEDFRPEFG